MKSEAHTLVEHCSGFSSLACRDKRARAWAYVFDCYRTKKAATSPVDRPNDVKEIKNDSRHHHRST
jgi:hypothetical protein